MQNKLAQEADLKKIEEDDLVVKVSEHMQVSPSFVSDNSALQARRFMLLGIILGKASHLWVQPSIWAFRQRFWHEYPPGEEQGHLRRFWKLFFILSVLHWQKREKESVPRFREAASSSPASDRHSTLEQRTSQVKFRVNWSTFKRFVFLSQS